jgi:hypothetical protein
MATKNKTEAETSEGVPVRTDQPRNARYEDGVAVRTDDVPEQTAGAKKAGQSADNTKEQ